jgi:integrase
VLRLNREPSAEPRVVCVLVAQSSVLPGLACHQSLCRFLKLHSRELRRALIELRAERLLESFLKGKNDISDELVSLSPDGVILDRDNLYHRYFQPVLTKAGLRKIRPHDLRHTFGSLLIQSGVSIAYVKEQMGHSSIQVTVDTYGHLIPGANVSFVDRLDVDEKSDEKAEEDQQQNATQAQPPSEAETPISLEVADLMVAAVGLEPTTYGL